MKSVIVKNKNSSYVDLVTDSRLMWRFLRAKESQNTAKANRWTNIQRHCSSKCKQTIRKDILNLKNDDRAHKLATELAASNYEASDDSTKGHILTKSTKTLKQRAYILYQPSEL